MGYGGVQDWPILTFIRPCWYQNFSTQFVKNVLCAWKDKLNKQSFEHKTDYVASLNNAVNFTVS
jgi:hypothetical protein